MAQSPGQKARRGKPITDRQKAVAKAQKPRPVAKKKKAAPKAAKK